MQTRLSLGGSSTPGGRGRLPAGFGGAAQITEHGHDAGGEPGLDQQRSDRGRAVDVTGEGDEPVAGGEPASEFSRGGADDADHVDGGGVPPHPRPSQSDRGDRGVDPDGRGPQQLDQGAADPGHQRVPAGQGHQPTPGEALEQAGEIGPQRRRPLPPLLALDRRHQGQLPSPAQQQLGAEDQGARRRRQALPPVRADPDHLHHGSIRTTHIPPVARHCPFCGLHRTTDVSGRRPFRAEAPQDPTLVERTGSDPAGRATRQGNECHLVRVLPSNGPGSSKFA